jgi:hypothetical protein
MLCYVKLGEIMNKMIRLCVLKILLSQITNDINIYIIMVGTSCHSVMMMNSVYLK